MNKIDWIDEAENRLGETTREEAHKEGLLHRIATVYVGNGKGEILVQVRVEGGHDHSAAGHLDAGEEYKEAAKRELSEELGIHDAELTEVGSAISDEPYTNGHIRHKFRIYYCNAKLGALNAEEVKEVYWADPIKLQEDMGVHPDKYAHGFRATLPVLISSKQ